jgi:hypothetical protein
MQSPPLAALGCISYNFMIREKKECKNNFVITPLLACHIEKFCTLEFIAYNDDTKTEFCEVKTYDFFPITEYQIKQILYNHTKKPVFSSSCGKTLHCIFNTPKISLTQPFTTLALKLERESFNFSILGCIRISKPDTNKVTGSVWCTLWTNHSNSRPQDQKKPMEEYWLTQDNVSISKFIVSFMDIKNIPIVKQFLVSYEVAKMDQQCMLVKAYLNHENTLLFAKNMLCH